MLLHWKEHDIDVNGVLIHYYEMGKEEKPALVLAHGFSDNGLCWLPVALDLEDEYHIILPDARGHGKSQRVQPSEQVDAPADLAGLIQVLGLKDPVLGGHSMGGNTVSMVAARFPALVKALILEDPGWRDPDPAARPGPSSDWLAGLQGKTVDELIAHCRVDSPTWPENELRPWAESKIQMDPNIRQVNSYRMPWRDVARAIRCPALLITADPEKGAIIGPDQAREVEALSAGFIQVANIPGVGHSIRRENFPAYMQAVRAFLAEVAQRA